MGGALHYAMNVVNTNVYIWRGKSGGEVANVGRNFALFIHTSSFYHSIRPLTY